MKQSQTAETKVTYKDWQGKCLSDIYAKIQAVHQLNFGRHCMIEVDEEIYTDQLEVLPPTWFTHNGVDKTTVEGVFSMYKNCEWNVVPKHEIQEAFQVGEAVGSVRGTAVFATYVKADDKFYYIGAMIDQNKK